MCCFFIIPRTAKNNNTRLLVPSGNTAESGKTPSRLFSLLFFSIICSSNPSLRPCIRALCRPIRHPWPVYPPVGPRHLLLLEPHSELYKKINRPPNKLIKELSITNSQKQDFNHTDQFMGKIGDHYCEITHRHESVFLFVVFFLDRGKITEIGHMKFKMVKKNSLMIW